MSDVNSERRRAKPLALDDLRRYRRLRNRFLLQLDQRAGREKAVLRRTIEALTRRLR